MNANTTPSTVRDPHFAASIDALAEEPMKLHFFKVGRVLNALRRLRMQRGR